MIFVVTNRGIKHGSMTYTLTVRNGGVWLVFRHGGVNRAAFLA